MMIFTPIIKPIFRGDKAAGQLYIGFANSQLAILERQMNLPKIKRNEGRRVVSPFDGVLVECISSFGYRRIIITVDEYSQVTPVELTIPTEEFNEEIEYFDDYPIFAVGVEDIIIDTGDGETKTIERQKAQLLEIPPVDFPLSEWSDEKLLYGDYSLLSDPDRDDSFRSRSFLQLKYANEIVQLENDIEVELTYTIAFFGMSVFDRIRITITSTNLTGVPSEDYDDLLTLEIPLPGEYQNVVMPVTTELQVSVFDYVAIGDVTSPTVAANFNEDKTKLYIFNQMVGMVYERVITTTVNGFVEKVEYILLNTFPVTTPVTCSYNNAYVDTDGIAHIGYSVATEDNPLYDPTMVGGASPVPNQCYQYLFTLYRSTTTYYKVDLNTEVVSEDTLATGGTTIISGKLAPIEWEVQPGDNTYIEGESWSNATGIVSYPSEGSSSSGISYNCSFEVCDYGYDSTNAVIQHIDSYITTGDGSNDYFRTEYEGASHFRCQSSGSYEVMGIVYPGGYRESFETWSGATDTRDASEVVVRTGTNYSSGVEYPQKYGSMISLKYSSGTTYQLVDSVKFGDPIDTYFIPSVLHPLEIDNADGSSSFLLHDQNVSEVWPEGITIAGVYYLYYALDEFGDLITGEERQWQIEVNGIHAQDAVFYDEIIDEVRVQNSLFGQDKFRYLSFLF